MLKIYGADLSSPANKVRFTANVLGIDYEYIRVRLMKGEHLQEEFLKKHPAGKIPVIDDDGFVLFESGAIIKYLARKKGSALYPKSLKEQALVDQWMDFIGIHIVLAVGKLLYNKIIAPMTKRPVDVQALKDGQRFLKRFLPVMDRQLKDRPFVCGETMTLADITLLAALDPVEAVGETLEEYRYLGPWCAAMRKKDFYTRCHESYIRVLEDVRKQRVGSLA